MTTPKEQRRIEALFEKWGRNTSSFQLLASGLEYYWSTKGIEGVIGYIKIKRTYVCAGDPLCADEDFYEFVHEFRQHCEKQKKKILFLQVSEEAKHRFAIMGFGSLKFGEEGIFDLNQYTFEGHDKRTVRQSANAAANKGVTISALANTTEEKQIEQLSKEWLKGKKTTGFSFLLSLKPLERKDEKKIYVAKLGGEVVGYLSAVPIPARNGYYFEDIIRSKDAPHGTNHLLIRTAVEDLKTQGASMATLGTSPLGNLRKEDNIEHKRINNLLAYIYEHVDGFYNFKGLYEFKASFSPNSWEKKYLCFYPKKLKANHFLTILDAYSRGGLPKIVLTKLRKSIKVPIKNPLKKLTVVGVRGGAPKHRGENAQAPRH